MPVFGYRGLSAEGRSVSGVIDADSPRTARGKLRASGIFPTDISEEAATAKRERSLRDLIPKIVHGISSGELALLTRQLATLLGASVPLEEALGALSDQAPRPHIRAMLSHVRERVREGSALADALAAHGEVFSDLYVSMVRAGESAGALEVVLERLADYGEKQSDLVSKIRGALTYPIIMMCVGTGIMAFLVSYVVPQVATIFQQTNQALPVVTQMLIAVSGFLASYWILLLLTFAILAGLVVFGLSTPRGRLFYDSWMLKLPYIGPTTIKIIAARFARTLATLLASGVQVIPALDAVKLVVTNRLLADAVEKSRESIREGHGMGQTLARSGLFPPLLVEMIRVGERSGELENMLERAADAYEREVAISLSQVTTMLEPLMTLMMAGMIVFMILAVLMPIFQLNQLVQ
jgi:general secretion pathway protein F